MTETGFDRVYQFLNDPNYEDMSIEETILAAVVRSSVEEVEYTMRRVNFEKLEQRYVGHRVYNLLKDIIESGKVNVNELTKAMGDYATSGETG